ncbi:MAG TPA: hypothetical protein VNS63_24765 [Blastocatellia bacterium]|nr:hypothetical protein [Blastocatellia bacterium]
MVSQEDFDRFVKEYNDDYVLLLTRASRRHYECLISSFLILKDLYNMIQVTFDSGDYHYSVLPYPYSFRLDSMALRHFGFDATEIENVFGFFEYVKQSQGMEFEDCLEAGTVAMCARPS